MTSGDLIAMVVLVVDNMKPSAILEDHRVFGRRIRCGLVWAAQMRQVRQIRDVVSDDLVRTSPCVAHSHGLGHVINQFSTKSILFQYLR